MRCNIIKILLYPIELLLIFLVKLYQWTISPLLPRSCRYYPTCSTYMLKAIKEWGMIKGVWLGTKRIFRCRPGCPTGEDFVPYNVKGELKWTY